METVIIGVLLFWLGSVWTLYTIRKQLFRLAEENNIKIVNNTIQSIEPVVLEIETHSNIFYLYDKKTNTFMCQGISLEELANNLNTFNKIKIAVVKYNEKLVWFKEGKVFMVQNES